MKTTIGILKPSELTLSSIIITSLVTFIPNRGMSQRPINKRTMMGTAIISTTGTQATTNIVGRRRSLQREGLALATSYKSL